MSQKNQKDNYVYFVLQRTLGDYHWFIKIGHSNNPKGRFYTYNTLHHEAFMLLSIPVGPKKLACAMERGFVRILKSFLPFEPTDYEGREWVPLRSEIKPILREWGIKHEVV